MESIGGSCANRQGRDVVTIVVECCWQMTGVRLFTFEGQWHSWDG